MAQLYLNEWQQGNEIRRGFIEIGENIEYVIPKCYEFDSALIRYFDEKGQRIKTDFFLDVMFGKRGAKIGEYEDGDDFMRSVIMFNYITRPKTLPYVGDED